MFKIVIALVLYLSTVGMSSAQTSIAHRNGIQFFYMPNLSKSRFDKSIENSHFGFGKDFYKTAKPSRPIIGYSFGLLYSRNISKTYKIELLFRRNIYGQSSPIVYNYKGTMPTNTTQTYGGRKYKVIMWSNSFSIGFQRSMFKKGKFFQFSLGSNIGIDVYEKARFKDYVLNKESGIVAVGCCTGYYYNFSTFQKLHSFYYPFKKGLYRLEFAATADAKFKLSKIFFFSIRPEFRYLTNLVGASPEFESLIPQGNIFCIGLNFGFGASF